MTYLDQLHQFEDQEQARTVSHPPLTLHCDPDTGRVLIGRHRGRHIDEVACEALERYDTAGHLVDCRVSQVRPWWRLGRSTAKVRLSAGARK